MRYRICLYSLPLGPAFYPRPCVVIDEKAVLLLPISSKLYHEHNHFLINDQHPDFGATGLQVSSYVFGAPIIEGRRERIIKDIGFIEGELAERFEDWVD